MPNEVPAFKAAPYVVVRSIGQEAAALSFHRASRHVPSASLGQDASLSFVVIGRGQGRFIRELVKQMNCLPREAS